MSYLNIVHVTFPPPSLVGIKEGGVGGGGVELKLLLQSPLWKSKTFPLALSVGNSTFIVTKVSKRSV